MALLGDIKIMMLKGEKGDKGDGVYDDTEIKAMIAQETQDREEEIAEMERNFLNYLYPVGSIYMTVSETSPAVLFGGTWEKIEGKFLLSSSSSHANGSTGGAETHKLKYEETPYHEHVYNVFDDSNLCYIDESVLTAYPTPATTVCGFLNATLHTQPSSGNGTPNYPTNTSYPVYSMNDPTHPEITSESATASFGIMPPYLTFNVWKRTA